MFGVPIDDDCCEKVELSDPKVLALACPVTDFTLTTDPKGIFQGVVCLSLVQPDLRLALHVDVKQPVHDEQCSLNSADFSKCGRQIVPPRIGGELPEELAGAHDTGSHRSRATKDVRPVGDNDVFRDSVSDQSFQGNCSPGGLSGYSVSWLRQWTAFPCRAMVMATRGLYPSAAMVWR